MTWAMAHGRAMIRSAQALHDLGMEPTGFIDVYTALRRAGIMLQCVELEVLFGIYCPPNTIAAGSKAGVLLNTHRTVIDQRHTAAHELGHHCFGHRACGAEATHAAEHEDPANWPVHEQEAEAFAAWFLMPPAAVRASLKVLGIAAISRPEEAYQISLHAGASYRGALRHLNHLKYLTAAQARTWSRLSPARLRERAAAGLVVSAPSRVWTMGAAASGSTCFVLPGDHLLINLGDSGDLRPLPRGLAPASGLEQAGMLPITDGIHLEVGADFSGGTIVLPAHQWEVNLAPIPIPRVGFNEP